MITSDGPLGRFVIATPTKCGTTTLEEMARRHGGGRVSRGGVEVPSFAIYTGEHPRRQHRMALPVDDEWLDAERYIMVRNPFARYVSMYEYLKAPHNYSKFGAREVQGRTWGGLARGKWSAHAHKEPMTFEQFLFFIEKSREWYGSGRWIKRRGDLFRPFAYRSPWVWLDSLEDSYALLRAQPGGGETKVLWLEKFWEEMAVLKENWGLSTLSVRPTIHANRTLRYAKPWWGYWADFPSCVQGVFKEAVRKPWPEDAEWLCGLGEEGGLSQPWCGCAACVLKVGQEQLSLWG